MVKVYEFIATGFEETEMITSVDLLRRANIEVCLVSITGDLIVSGAHGISILADQKFEELDFIDGDMLLLPGGQPGTNNLGTYEPLQRLLRDWHQAGKALAAICAAPTVFGELGFLKGKRATCYPGCEEKLIGAIITNDKVVTDGNITTSRGVGTAIDFTAEIIKILVDEKKAEKIKESIVYKA